MQTALEALGLGVYGLFAGALASDEGGGPSVFRRMSWLMGLLGAVPWALVNLILAAGLWLSPGFSARMQAGTEDDYARILAEHLTPLGMSAFPEVPLLAAVMTAVALWHLRRTPRPSARQANPT